MDTVWAAIISPFKLFQMSTKKVSKSDSATTMTLPVVNAQAAGIDVGSRFHVVAVGQDREQDVRQFGVTTPDLHELCQYLQSRGIKNVALESTGYYWIPLYWMLHSYAFDTIVVNPADIKKFKKTDVEDARWIRQLHALGLLKPSFQMDDFGEMLRSYTRRRRSIIQERNRQVNRMHKVLVLMNIQIGTQLTDLGGASGMDIVRAITNGEREPQKLLAFVRKGVKTPQEELLKALQGTWQPQFIFELKQLLQSYDMSTRQIAECDVEIESLLEHWYTDNNRTPPDPKSPLKPGEKKAVDGKNLPPLQVSRMLNDMLGGNLLDIGGLNGGCLLEIIAETGTTLHQFPSAKHFAAWLGLAPNNKKSGGKLLSSRTPKRTNNAAVAFRQIANAIGRCKNHELKPFFHSIQKKNGWKGAVTATARKLAVSYFYMITTGEPFIYEMSEEQLQRKRDAVVRKIKKTIKELNLTPQELELIAA